MSSLFALILIYFTFLILSPGAYSSASSDDKNLTAYDIIQLYNFPIGILPKGITGYDLDESTGKFSAYLDGTCSFSIEGSYKLSYKSTIKGKISKNKLSNLEGVKVKILFLWVDIVEVERKGDDLEFSVGIASAGFSIDNFDESPQCGCGFDCGDKENQVSKLRTNPFGLSSY
ncbi:hypothetical protein LguiA_008048 [Lonicera macranthoides]